MKLRELLKAGIVRDIDDAGGGGGAVVVEDPIEEVTPEAAAEAAAAAAITPDPELTRLANENAALKAQLEVRVQQPAPVIQTTTQELDPFEQAAQDLAKQGIQDWMPEFSRALNSRALAIQAERSERKILSLVGDVVLPLRNKDAVQTIAGADPLAQQFAAKWVGKINPQNAEEVELLQLAAERYAEKNRPASANVTVQKSTTTAPQISAGMRGEAERLATVAGNSAYALTDAEIAAALAEAG